MPRTASTMKDSSKKTSEPKKRRGRPRKADKVVTVPEKKEAAPIQEIKPKSKRRTYLYAVGRRKTAIARVRYHRKGEGILIINNKKVEEYFPTEELRQIAKSPLEKISHQLQGDITIRVGGGGIRGQAESVRHGIARVLVLLDKANRPQLKSLGFLKRDARVKERKKYGLKRARRAPQWQKR